MTELESYYKNFLNSPGEQSIVKLVVAPYNLVDGYPWENPLAETSKEDYIGMLVVALWELRASIKDANFVLNPQTANMFALGTKNQTRSSRIAFVKQQRDAWQREYDKLLAAAQQCDRSFSEKCKALAEYYDRYRNLTEQRYAVLPARYLSDCYARRTLKEFAKLSNDLRSRTFGTPVAGDNETGGNPSRVVAELVLTPDQRQLQARLAVAKIEWKRGKWKGMPLEVRTNAGESGWGLQSQAIVFDLDNPAQFGLEQDNLRQCVFETGLGLNTSIAPPAAACFHRYGFNQKRIHGLIDGITGKNPRGQQYFGEGEGLLNYITCEVDRQGKDDNMQCMQLGLRNLKLSLLNTLDINADVWVRPPKPELPTALTAFFGEPTLVAAQHAKQFSQYKQLAAADKQVVDDVKARKGEARERFKALDYQLPDVQKELINKRIKRTPAIDKPNPRMPASN